MHCKFQTLPNIATIIVSRHEISKRFIQYPYYAHVTDKNPAAVNVFDYFHEPL